MAAAAAAAVDVEASCRCGGGSIDVGHCHADARDERGPASAAVSPATGPTATLLRRLWGHSWDSDGDFWAAGGTPTATVKRRASPVLMATAAGVSVIQYRGSCAEGTQLAREGMSRAPRLW